MYKMHYSHQSFVCITIVQISHRINISNIVEDSNNNNEKMLFICSVIRQRRRHYSSVITFRNCTIIYQWSVKYFMFKDVHTTANCNNSNLIVFSYQIIFSLQYIYYIAIQSHLGKLVYTYVQVYEMLQYVLISYYTMCASYNNCLRKTRVLVQHCCEL